MCRIGRMKWLLLAALFAASAAGAQDVGLVDRVSGDVTYSAPGGKAEKVKAYMKVREGDRFQVPASAQVRVVYFESARYERWAGPAMFRTTRERSTAIQGLPAEVATLPASVPRRIARVPELLQNARLGGVQLRGIKAPPSVASEKTLRDAKGTYESLRAKLPKDDIMPELFLYAVLSEHGRHDELPPVIAEMQRKQPDSEEVKWLARSIK